jgi:hypothetical protein
VKKEPKPGSVAARSAAIAANSPKAISPEGQGVTTTLGRGRTLRRGRDHVGSSRRGLR